MELSRSVIQRRIHAAIQPQLDHADALLDHYTEDLPPEVWKPIAVRVASDHYARSPFHKIPGSFAAFVEELSGVVENLIRSVQKPLSRDDLTEVGP